MHLNDVAREKFFCKTHLRAPLKEKIARIERAVRLLEKSSSRDQELLAEIAQVDESPIAEAPDVTPTPVDPLMQCSATLSFFSPEQLRDRTVQRMRDCGVVSIPFRFYSGCENMN
ncbi:hypothetical protein ANCCAN_26160 [Ancylostoma caninum]|uniref:Uncharacterized protein n=1 Tax=Ancylostoma caninum TaxID=29170 RepID=A0A368FB12_ANCCA|nr:hypothetical protein ANCCAN_26160 [Ancylostoma caninum]